MKRLTGYNESHQLTHLIERLRERLGADPLPNPPVVEELEEMLARLVARNQRLRALQRIARTSGLDARLDSMRGDLEKLDAQLLQELPALLERMP
jgi:transposase-like protein